MDAHLLEREAGLAPHVFSLVVWRNGMNLLQINAFWQKVALGILVFLACAIDAVRQKREKNKAA